MNTSEPYFLKILSAENLSVGKDHDYTEFLPKRGGVGPWTPYIPLPEACRRGWHLVKARQSEDWLSCGEPRRIFLAQYAGKNISDGGNKIAVSTIRLIGEINLDYNRLVKLAEGTNKDDVASLQKEILAYIKGVRSPGISTLRHLINLDIKSLGYDSDEIGSLETVVDIVIRESRSEFNRTVGQKVLQNMCDELFAVDFDDETEWDLDKGDLASLLSEMFSYSELEEIVNSEIVRLSAAMMKKKSKLLKSCDFKKLQVMAPYSVSAKDKV